MLYAPWVDGIPGEPVSDSTAAVIGRRATKMFACDAWPPPSNRRISFPVMPRSVDEPQPVGDAEVSELFDLIALLAPWCRRPRIHLVR